MALWQAAVLGIVQGLSEFLPISSSGHLELVRLLLGWDDPGLAFDVALHWGTLLAVLYYFREDWRRLIAGAAAGLRRRVFNDELRLIAQLALASVPAAAAGVLLDDLVETTLHSPWVIVGMLAGVGVLLWLVDRRAKAGDPRALPGWGAALLIGVAQAVALVPGTSRSGITMAAGLALGLPRAAAARFSFLLAAPIIFGAGLVKLPELSGAPLAPIAVGVLTSAVSGGLAIAFLLRHLSTRSFVPFAVYRLVVAAAVAALLLFGA